MESPGEGVVDTNTLRQGLTDWLMVCAYLPWPFLGNSLICVAACKGDAQLSLSSSVHDG